MLTMCAPARLAASKASQEMLKVLALVSLKYLATGAVYTCLGATSEPKAVVAAEMPASGLPATSVSSGAAAVSAVGPAAAVSSSVAGAASVVDAGVAVLAAEFLEAWMASEKDCARQPAAAQRQQRMHSDFLKVDDAGKDTPGQLLAD